MVLVAWPLAAFGGTTWSTAIPYSVACVLAAVALGVQFRGTLDVALTLLAAGVLLQAVPLPAIFGVNRWLSPNRDELLASMRLGAAERVHSLPLSIDPSSTLWALAVTAGAILFFWTARTRFDRGGVRQVVRVVAGLGFVVSLLAVAQATTAGRSIYWMFPTHFEGPLPFGPFVNRNHFATWTIMAIPLCLGYLAARLGSNQPKPTAWTLRARIADAIEPRTAWLTAAAGTMVIALLLSLSRSGALALGVSMTITYIAARHRFERRQRRLVIVAVAVILAGGAMWADVPALARRASDASSAMEGRLTIWRESAPIVRDFWQVGTGAGTYQRAMYVYQQSDRTVYFNQAHNHYLQVAVEGGVMFIALFAFATIAFVREARRRVSEDTTGMVMLRIGALCGLGAVALQSVWETGLTMPANAALAALLAAIAVHERPH